MNLICVDIDGTLLKGQTQILLLKYLFGKRRVGVFDLINVFFWYFKYKYLGSEINVNLVNKMYKKLIGGISLDEMEEITNDFMNHISNKIDKTVVDMVKKMKDSNDKVVLVTSTIKPIAEKFLPLVNASDISSTELEIVDKVYSGKTINGVNNILSKKDFINKNKVGCKNVIFITDHESDLELLKIANRPIVVNPTRKLKSFAIKAKWEIIIT